MPHSIYLDNSATTPVRPEVQEAMLPYLGDKWGNPSSVHYLGRESRKAIDEARQSVAALVGCEEDEVYFTPCATYSNNTALIGRARFVEANNLGRHLITTTIEHPSCIGPAKHLESLGWDVTYLEVDRQGLLDPDVLAQAIKPETSMVSIMWANNEIGSVQQIEVLARVARDAGVFFHTDAVQVPGKLTIDLRSLPADTLSLSGHKFHAPKGIGVLVVRKGTNLMPLIFGGGQERALFPGTEPLPNIVAIGTAAKLAATELVATREHLRAMQRILWKHLLSIPGIVVTGPQDLEQRLPGHLSFLVPSTEGEAIVMQADLRGLCISSASACHKGITQPSHVVKSLGYSDEEALGSVRVSAGAFNSEEQCQKAGEILTRIIAAIRPQVASSANSSSSSCQV